ncbi:MAG TPA: ATP-binding protein [Kofleriaceae bacterium]|nr:ATP-binding protein [Kofleriaceae bacterium]
MADPDLALADQARVLEMIARDRPLSDVLAALCEVVERRATVERATIDRGDAPASAAWSLPIIATDHRVLATLTTSSAPAPASHPVCAAVARIAAIAIERADADRALRGRAARHQFLAQLSAAIQGLSDPADIMATAARRLCDHVGADRCAYAEVEGETVFVITGDHARGVRSIVGRWDVAAFGAACVDHMLAGRPYIVEDAELDPRLTPDDLIAYRATEIRSVICVALHKHRKFTAAMAVHQRVPRRWTPDELAEVTEVAARCWEALERARANRIQRDADRALADSRARLDYAVRLSGVGFWYCDLPFAELSWDARVKQHFFLPADARVTIETFYERIVADDREATRAAIEASIRNQTSYDIVYRTHDGHGAIKFIRALGGAAYAADGTPLRFDGVTVDVTAHKLDEQRLAAVAEQLREHDRRKDEFLATLAHELRNPLAPIRTGLHVLGLAPSEDQAARTRDMMARQLGHLVHMVDDLLDISRVTLGKITLKRSRIDLRAVIDSALETTRSLVEAGGHALAVRVPARPLPLDADATRLSQVVANLINNAAKYTPPGGQIALDVEAEPGTVRVRVSDTGVGIPADMLPYVFDMFTQVGRSIDRSQGGLGIGLTLVRRLIEMHGGTVSATSPGPGAGSTFVVELPLAAVPELSAAEPAAPGAAASGLRVLVVDDNLDAAETLAMLLELSGNRVELAHTGVTALAAAAAFQPDVMFLDIGLPELNGYEVARRLRADPAQPQPLLVALTGWGSDDDRRQARDAGFDRHLVKPVDAAKIADVLDSVAR